MILTALFWRWSGMASLGVFYLLFGAPVVMLGCAATIDARKSRYHAGIRVTAWGYILLWLPTFLAFLNRAVGGGGGR